MQKQKNMQANMKLHLHNGQVSNVPQWTMDTMSIRCQNMYMSHNRQNGKRTQYVPNGHNCI